MNTNIKSVAHRGHAYYAPENTLASYKLAKKNGFNYVECDISFTKDCVPVLLHDGSIDRTSNSKGNVEDYTVEELKKFDFGSWKDKKYEGEKIPTFYEFILLCKNLNLHPYIEIKPIDDVTKIPSCIKKCVDIVNMIGMKDKVSFISFSHQALIEVNKLNPNSRLGLISYKVDFNSDEFKEFIKLKNNYNELFIDYYSKAVDDILVNNMIKYDLPLEVWVIDELDDLYNMNPYISGVTSNKLNAEIELKKHILG